MSKDQIEQYSLTLMIVWGDWPALPIRSPTTKHITIQIRADVLGRNYASRVWIKSRMAGPIVPAARQERAVCMRYPNSPENQSQNWMWSWKRAQLEAKDVVHLYLHCKEPSISAYVLEAKWLSWSKSHIAMYVTDSFSLQLDNILIEVRLPQFHVRFEVSNAC